MLFLLTFINPLYSATIYSIATGNWNSGNTWSTTSGGSSCSCTPSSTDDVIVEDKDVVTVTADATANSLTINRPSINGTTQVNVNTGITLTITGDITTQAASGQKKTNLTLTGSAIFKVGGALTIGNEFSIGSSTVEFNSNSSQTIPVFSYNNLTISSSSGTPTKTLAGNIDISGNLTIALNTTLDVSNGNNYSINLEENWTNNGTFTSRNGTVTMDGTTGTKTIKSNGSPFYNLTFNDAGGTGVFELQDNIDINNNLTITGGTFDVKSVSNFSVNVAGNLINNDVFTSRSGLVTFDGTGATQTFNPGSSAFYNVTITNSNASGEVDITTNTLTINNNLSITDGILDDNGKQITGNTSGTFTMSSGTQLLIGNGINASGFPTLFTYNNITFNINSKIIYNASTAQNVSGVPTYGTLKLLQGVSTKTLLGNTTVQDSLYIDQNVTFDLSTNNYSLTVKGPIIKHASGGINTRNSTITYNGGVAASLICNNCEFYNLTINNNNLDITLDKPLTITNNLTLTSGDLITTSTNLLTLDVNATISGASASSYISGPVAKKTNSLSEFVFPLGKNGRLVQASVTPTSTNNTTFTAEYFDAAYSNTTSLGTGVNHVSIMQYWQINRSSGSPANAKIKLYWDANSNNGIVDNLTDLILCHFDGTNWQKAGDATFTTTGTTTSGTVITNTAQTSFSPFTLGSSTSNNPLPIKLLDFSAESDGQIVRLNWSTAIEINNDYFTIERSKDGLNFEYLTIIDGAGNNQNKLDYSLIDNSPILGTSYYRLKQTDFDGKYEYFSPVSVTFSKSTFQLTSIFPNPCVNYTTIEMETGNDDLILLEIYNQVGQEVIKKEINAIKGTNKIEIDISNLEEGLYFITLTNIENAILTTKFYKFNVDNTAKLN